MALWVFTQSLSFLLESNTSSGVSLSTFRANIPKYFKKARVKSDRCSCCYYGSRFLKNLQERAATSPQPQPTPASTASVGTSLTATPSTPLLPQSQSTPSKLSPIAKAIARGRCNLLLNGIEQILSDEERDQVEGYLTHHTTVTCRMQDFHRACRKLQPGQCVIVVDYKANLPLGVAEVTTDQEFFNAPESSVFAVVVAYRDSTCKVPGETDCQCSHFLGILVLLLQFIPLLLTVFPNFCSTAPTTGIKFLTDCYLLRSLEHNSANAIHCIEQTLQSARFKEKNFTSIDLWADNGE